MCAFLARSATDGLFLKSYRLQEVKNKTEYWVKSIVLKCFFNIYFADLLVVFAETSFTIAIGQIVQTPNHENYFSVSQISHVCE